MIKASYSLSLLVALKLHLAALQVVFPVSEVSTITTPAPLMLLDHRHAEPILLLPLLRFGGVLLAQ